MKRSTAYAIVQMQKSSFEDEAVAPCLSLLRVPRQLAYR